MAVSAARAIPPFPQGAAPPPRTRSFWARPGAGAKRLDSSPLGPLTTKSTSRPRTLEEPARFTVRWHVRPGSLMTGLRSRSPPTESPSPVLSLGGYLRPGPTPFRSWCPARARTPRTPRASGEAPSRAELSCVKNKLYCILRTIVLCSLFAGKETSAFHVVLELAEQETKRKR